jgi:hypothetical protein
MRRPAAAVAVKATIGGGHEAAANPKSGEEAMASMTRSRVTTGLRRVALALGVAVAFGAMATAAPQAPAGPQSFASPAAAVDALVAAARADQAAAMLGVLGPAGRRLVDSGDAVADHDGRAKFVADFDKAHAIQQDGDRATLVIGDEQWPVPIPIVKAGDSWHFDAAAAAQEILARRVGRNELAAIEVCRAYVDAQRDYAAVPRNGSKELEYAQKFMSTPGHRDGLYWEPAAGEAPSPLGPQVAAARAEGYGAPHAKGEHAPYHGYYYRILTRQGKDAPGGAYDYVVGGHMIGGFALVAFPAKRGDSGVKTFIINQDGAVYEKDLGPNTAVLAGRMTAFDPGDGWTKAP